MILEEKRQQKLKFNDYKTSLVKHLKLSQIDNQENVEENHVPKPEEFEIKSAFTFSMLKNVKSIVNKEYIQPINILNKKVKENDSFSLSSKQSNKNIFVSEMIDTNKLQQSENEEGKMAQNKGKIFEESQDLYYREINKQEQIQEVEFCLLYTSPSPRD